MIREFLKRVLPEKVVSCIRSIKRITEGRKIINSGFKYDRKKFKRFSASYRMDTREKMKAFLVKEYHAVEKGLALPKPRIGFGQQRISNLIECLYLYIDKYGVDDVVVVSKEVLAEYIAFNSAKNKDKNINIQIQKVKGIVTKINNLINADITYKGGTREVFKQEIIQKGSIDFESFFKSRHSIRDFSDEPVEIEKIINAIDIAKYVPSVCNRQAWKAYVIRPENVDLKEKLLSNQNGNKGFGDKISSLVVVTGKLSHFFAFERNQVFIDGGMFAMSIVLALHSKGLGTCCLNLSYTAEKNKIFDTLMDFDEDTVPIMYIAVGNLKDAFKIAVSTRKEVDEIVRVC